MLDPYDPKLWKEVRNALGKAACRYYCYLGSLEDNWDLDMLDQMADDVVEVIKAQELEKMYHGQE